jgi:thioredoxin-like negative regulator of GroEL
MDRTIVKKTTLKEQDEAFCKDLTLDERLKVIEDLNRVGCELVRAMVARRDAEEARRILD